MLLCKIKHDFEFEEVQADTDALTGLANTRAFHEKLEMESERSKRYHSPSTLIYFDLDNFKAVNDTRGHAEGDEVLKSVSAVLVSCVRKVDTIARLGGDEFAVLFPETDFGAAEIIIGNIRPRLNAAMEEKGWPVTFSIGSVTFEKPMDHIREMIRLADDQMYAIKKTGKNNVAMKLWPEEPQA